MKLAMPEPKYTYIISDPHGNTLGGATTMKRAIGMVEELTHQEVVVSDEWMCEENKYRYELTNYHYIDKITLNQL